jgi:hypothetical protein
MSLNGRLTFVVDGVNGTATQTWVNTSVLSDLNAAIQNPREHANRASRWWGGAATRGPPFLPTTTLNTLPKKLRRHGSPLRTSTRPMDGLADELRREGWLGIYAASRVRLPARAGR